jgi:hypothetical protein
MTLIHNYSDEDHQRLRGLNFNGCLGWTRLVLPQMYERKRGEKKNNRKQKKTCFQNLNLLCPGRIVSASSLATVFSCKEGLYGTDKVRNR